MLHQVSTHLILGSESVSPTLWDPTDWFLSPGSSVQGILQARMLEWVAISFSKGSSRSRDRTLVSCIAGRFFTVWASILKYYHFTILQPRKLHFTILQPRMLSQGGMKQLYLCCISMGGAHGRRSGVLKAASETGLHPSPWEHTTSPQSSRPSRCLL